MRHRQNDLFICHDNAWQAIYDVLYRGVLHQQYKQEQEKAATSFVVTTFPCLLV